MADFVFVQYVGAFLAAVTVFFITMAMVIGPTPPGTGVINPAFSFTADWRQKQTMS